jgi:hypothetical protein
VDEQSEHLVRALAKLEALREVVASAQAGMPFSLHHVEDFHAALDHLDETGLDTDEFRIGEVRIRRVTKPGGKDHIRREDFLPTIEAVLGYFNLSRAVGALREESREHPERVIIGFQTHATLNGRD